MRHSLWLSAAALAASLLGCQTTGAAGRRAAAADTQALPPGLPAALAQPYRELQAAEPRDRVLARLEFATRALDQHAPDTARVALDEALAEISSVFSNDENAARARSLWYSEGQKDFKGEPYERAMAYLYRGLLYALDGEMDNARASFKAGLLQDAFLDEQQKYPDFGLLLYLQGFASEQQGDAYLSQLAWDELQKLRPDLGRYVPGRRLVVIESGSSPRKVSDGFGHSELKYRRGKGAHPVKITLVSPQGPLAARFAEDVYWQASTRGGRPVDKILQGKAQFLQDGAQLAEGLAETSRVMSVVGSYAGPALGVAGAAVGVAAGVTALVALSANPEADTRFWSGLPNLVHVLEVPPGATPPGALWEVEYEDGYRAVYSVEKTLVARSTTLEWYRLIPVYRPYQRSYR